MDKMGEIMSEEVLPEGYMCESCLGISPNWEDIRTKFGYPMLYPIESETSKSGRLCMPVNIKNGDETVNKTDA